ncbi:conserved protein of unknown function [Ruminococcaceae bacterium BL-6]|nr:conserved protein of unknown function [Ruminococcaceae bacterium BL-6]
MTRREMIDRMFERYGTPVTVYSAGNPPAGARALIQPLSGKLYPDEACLPAGCFDRSHYFYLGSAARRLDRLADAEIGDGERSYRVIRARGVDCGGETLYVWAVLEEKEEEETDGGA